MADDSRERSKRHRQRRLFDSVADLYDTCRPGYPGELVAAMVATAGAGAGSRVLEVGCGTGQLTGELAAYGFDLTAVDLGVSMVSVARQRLAGGSVAFQVSSFEDFEAPAGAFSLVVSATAFHWVDPEVAWTKAARLLAPGGWLAVLGTRESYDDPLGAALLDAWVRRSDDGGAWMKAQPPTVAEQMAASGLFGTPVARVHTERRTMPSEKVLGLEQTRATSLSFDPPARASFLAELAAALEGSTEVGLTQHTTLVMGQRLG